MRPSSLRSFVALAFAGAVFSCAEAPTAPEQARNITVRAAELIDGPSVVISQVYGGGGNSGATLRNDFIELFNRDSVPVSLNGWSVQYASATSTAPTWAVTALSGTLEPGQYYLVQQAVGTGGTVSLPTPDAAGTIAMAAGAGKVVLVSTTTPLTGACPTSAAIVNRVPYGSTNCNGASGWPTGTTATLTNTTAAIRAANGCTHADAMPTDFATGSPAPRNTASPRNSCLAPPVVTTVSVTPSNATVAVGSTVALTAQALDADDAPVSGESFAFVSLSPEVATVNAAGIVTGVDSGTAIIEVTASPSGIIGSAVVNVMPADDPDVPADARITEIHYDNDGADVGEQIEITGNAGGSLAGWSIVLYNQTNNAQYATIALTGTIPEQCDGRGTVVFPAVGMQNGPADGIALIAPGGAVVEFLSYEGTLTAADGPAVGTTSTDIGVDEPGSTPVGRSLFLATDGLWYGPVANSFGQCNGAPPPNTMSITGRFFTDPALPVGYQDQLFASITNGRGDAVPVGVTWVSENPSVASIDARGVITGISAGSATFRATAADSAATTSSITLPVAVAVASASADYQGNAEFGEPTDGNPADDYIVRHPQFTSSFNPVRNIPNWVSYEIDISHFGAEDRCDCFTYDAELPASFTRYTTADYTGAGAFHGFGIDRGHLARSFDRTSASLDNARTYLFSNIIPQANSFNTGVWATLENRLGDYARFENKEVYVIAGASGSQGTLKDEGIITLPRWTWKVAVIVAKDTRLADITSRAQMQVIAVVMPNFGSPVGTWENYQVTVDSVEALSGYDLLALLRDDFEIAIESNTQPPVAAHDGPYTGAEGGAAVAMSAAASTDADNDALTYAWSFGDGAGATGIATSHTYAQDGVYSVRLIVTDIRGLSDTTFTTATISNVAPSVTALPSATLLVGETYAASGSFSDPGADSWSASVDFGDGSTSSVPLSGNSWSIAHAYTSAGSFTVSLGVNDGSTTTTVSALVTVWTGAEGLAAAQSMVGAMVAAGTLSNGEGNSLGAKLRAAAAALERGQAATAINQLQAALNQLDALVQSGRLTSAQAAALRDLITRIIAALD